MLLLEPGVGRGSFLNNVNAFVQDAIKKSFGAVHVALICCNEIMREVPPTLAR